MKYIILLVLTLSCALHNNKSSLKEPNKFSYLQEFYKIRDLLKKETKSCKHYTENVLKKLVILTKGGYDFADSKKVTAQYTPEIFDWNNKAKIAELYLNYEYSYDIVNEHFEIVNNIQDCMNEFDHRKFIHAAINAKNINVLKRYFSYLKSIDVSPLNILIAASFVETMEKEKIITISNTQEFKIRKSKLESLFSETGKNSLSFFRNKDFKQVYSLALNLKQEKDRFKDYLLSSIKFK